MGDPRYNIWDSDSGEKLTEYAVIKNQAIRILRNNGLGENGARELLNSVAPGDMALQKYGFTVVCD